MFRLCWGPLREPIRYASLFPHNRVLRSVFDAAPERVALTVEPPGGGRRWISPTGGFARTSFASRTASSRGGRPSPRHEGSRRGVGNSPGGRTTSAAFSPRARARRVVSI
ncbi:unnamed protein product [Phytomonas sp. Hart1]|nr:unnamed protein product [Phytomonas sp. Hart1]|eukprot:CCW68697.1 unnamed protein product [Phytomonas sp. isolate Hart1]